MRGAMGFAGYQSRARDGSCHGERLRLVQACSDLLRHASLAALIPVIVTVWTPSKSCPIVNISYMIQSDTDYVDQKIPSTKGMVRRL